VSLSLPRGEQLHIIQWSDDLVNFATNAISPAKISRVSIVESSEKIMEMVVEDSQLSLAIGKKGQNVRLASKLIGWRIDIKSEEEKRAEVESQMEQMQATPTPLENMPGLTPGLVQKLNAAGIGTVEQLADLSPEDLENVPGIGEKTIEKISDALSEYYTQSPAYQDQMERLAQQHMFRKDEPQVEAAPEPTKTEESREQKLPEE
jgi:N utilization substance protein A